MEVRISRALLQRIIDEAAASPKLEVCGLLFGSPQAIDAVQACRNVAADPVDSFEIDPAALLAAHRAARAGGPAIAGCYHSHPGGPAEPSARDAAAAAPDGALWVIVGGGAVRAWRARRDGRGFDPVELAVAPCASSPAPPQGRDENPLVRERFTR
ncbi:Mov34/MPN/PAD-1 family protein [Hephaestia sp. GCM10023244]|uniref:Mov34/MPN/PAD-1 family protein n=1 Tax=unclassified Hephaestia TaxID=2631281 RepID=UPI00207756DB|nr:M67 family metallopeptidase [Hephaestia sp. MAHUQ-44]MCM8730099.1 M67 family metallopeptidase [Hephaestia sp. MAHUQ-44]